MLLLAVVYLADYIFIIIRSGEAGVFYNRFTGTQVDRVYGEGLHILNPLNTMFIYETRKQVTNHEFDVLSVRGLPLHLSLVIRYRPEYDLLAVLHQRVGPDYLTRVVIPQTESVMRKELGNYTAEQIYTNADGLLTRAILAAMEEVGRNFVEVEDIIIREIRLPEKVRLAIESKLHQEELLKSYEFRTQTAAKEAERKRIQAAGVRDYQKIVDETLSDRLLAHQGIQATQEMAESDNPKVVVIGAGKEGVPIILGGQ